MYKTKSKKRNDLTNYYKSINGQAQMFTTISTQIYAIFINFVQNP